MEQTEPLRGLLADLGQAFNGGDRVPILFPGEHTSSGDRAPAAMATTPDEEIVLNPDVTGHYGVDLDGPDQLRLLTDALHHEVEHVRETDLGTKSDVADEHGGNAANIFNLVEDQYINRTRTERHRGRRKDLAFKAEVAIWPTWDDVSDLPPEQGLPQALAQLCWNTRVKGYSDLPDEHKEFLAWARRRINTARYTDDQADRVDIAVEIATELEDLVDFSEWEVPDWLKDLLDTLRRIESGQAGSGEPDADADAGGAGEADPDADADEGDGAGDADGGEGEDGDQDADAGSPGDAGDGDATGDTGRADDADLERDIKDLEDADGETPTGDDLDGQPTPHGVVQYDTPEVHVQRYERVRAEEAHRDTDLGYYERKRAQIIESDAYDEGGPRDAHSHRSGGRHNGLNKWTPYTDRQGDEDRRGYRTAPADEVAERMARDHTAEAIEDAFREFKTRPRERQAREGPRLHRDNARRFMAGERDIPLYQRRERRQELGDRVVGVAIDSSGSMMSKELEAKMALASVAKACEVIGDDFLATTFQVTSQHDHDLGLVTGPDEPFEYDHLDAMVPGSAECPAPAAMWTADLMDRAGGREKVLIVIHDGKPHVGFDSGSKSERDAVSDMHRAVDELRRDGITVIGMGVGDDVQAGTMADMFGDDGWVMCDTDNLADELVRIYRRQMDVSLR